MIKGLIVALTAIALGLLLQPVMTMAASEDDILGLINAERSQAGLGTVSMDSSLTEVASIRAQECSTYFSHTRPDGSSWSTVSVLTNGENLARARDNTQSKPENVVLAWMLSPKHRANVLKSAYTNVGIAYYYGDNGETIIVCEFN